MVGETLLNLASVVQFFDPAAALEHLERGGEIMSRYEGPAQRTLMVVMDTNIGKCLLALGRPREAADHLHAALERSTTTPDPRLLDAEARISLADALLELGESEEALAHLRRARDAIEDVDDPRWKAATARLARLPAESRAG